MQKQDVLKVALPKGACRASGFMTCGTPSPPVIWPVGSPHSGGGPTRPCQRAGDPGHLLRHNPAVLAEETVHGMAAEVVTGTSTVGV